MLTLTAARRLLGPPRRALAHLALAAALVGMGGACGNDNNGPVAPVQSVKITGTTAQVSQVVELLKDVDQRVLSGLEDTPAVFYFHQAGRGMLAAYEKNDGQAVYDQLVAARGTATNYPQWARPYDAASLSYIGLVLDLAELTLDIPQ